MIYIQKIKKSFVAALLLTLIFTQPSAAFYDAAEEEVQLPIIMYHFLCDKCTNPWSITGDNFEKDLQYLKENQYETVVMEDLINYVYYGISLPEKPVVLTFDDGDTSIYNIAYPLLEKYDMKAVVSIIGYVTDDYTEKSLTRTDIKHYPNLNWFQIKEMVESGRIELQNHSYQLHNGNGAAKIKGETTAEYSIRLAKDLLTLQYRIEEELGNTPTTFTYPFGAISKESNEILKQLGFSASLACENKNNTLTMFDPDCLYSMGRFIRENKYSSQYFFDKIVNKNQ